MIQFMNSFDLKIPVFRVSNYMMYINLIIKKIHLY